MEFVAYVLIFLGVMTGKTIKNNHKRKSVPILIICLTAGILIWKFVQPYYAGFFFGMLIPWAEELWEYLKNNFLKTK